MPVTNDLWTCYNAALKACAASNGSKIGTRTSSSMLISQELISFQCSDGSLRIFPREPISNQTPLDWWNSSPTVDARALDGPVVKEDSTPWRFT